MATLETNAAGRVERKQIDIRIQQRNGRKSITTISGLDVRLDFERLLKEFKKRWGCNGVVHEVKETDESKKEIVVEVHIQLQGDQREHVRDFLISEKLCKGDNIRIAGL
jgi:translation initiation factor 1